MSKDKIMKQDPDKELERKPEIKLEKVPAKKLSGNRLQWIAKHKGVVVPALFLAIAALLAFGLVKGGLRVGAAALKEGFTTAFSEEKEAAYQAQYEKYFEKAEEQYHVSNRVAISIGELKETAQLEVLKVSDVEYIVEDSTDNRKGITSWLEVPGEATYVVNLQAAEFVVDNERSYVLVRAPYPELTNISIDYADIQLLLFENDVFNESYKVGESLAQQQIKTADLMIKKEFSSNQHFYLSAQNAAVSTIQYLVKQLNPEVEDLTVEVEFY